MVTSDRPGVQPGGRSEVKNATLGGFWPSACARAGCGPGYWALSFRPGERQGVAVVPRCGTANPGLRLRNSA